MTTQKPKVPPNVLWLSVSPHLKGFDQRLLGQLVKTATVRRWDYCQTADEPCCTDDVIDSLHEYLSERASLEKSWEEKNWEETSWEAETAMPQVHLLGHGLSGVIGLLYARRYPQYVASLTLLSVGSLPAVNWQAYYYALRQHLPCSRERVLAQMTQLLFGEQPCRFSRALAELLTRDLDNSLTLHSLAHHTHIEPSRVEVPLLICNGAADAIMQSQKEPCWDKWMHLRNGADQSDQADHPHRSPQSPQSFDLWHCPQGNHFFHFHHPQSVAAKITSYWHQLSDQKYAELLSPKALQQSHKWLK
jgi:surfactin synthase thioesterase subunit